MTGYYSHSTHRCVHCERLDPEWASGSTARPIPKPILIETNTVTLPRRDLVWLLLEVMPTGFGAERAGKIAAAAGIDLAAEAERT